MILTILQAGTILFCFIGIVLILFTISATRTRKQRKALDQWTEESNERLRVQQEKWERLECEADTRLAKLFEDK
jgi:flagellar biosynthesis/type III secretory pathway M-ring protein FliF/YscJ